MTIEPKLMTSDDLAEIGRLAPQAVTQLDGLHGDPARWGNWIGHRNYAQWCVRILAHVAAQDIKIAWLTQLAAERYEEAEELHAAAGEPTQGPQVTIAGLRERIAELELHPCNEQRAHLVDEVVTLNAKIAGLRAGLSDAINWIADRSSDDSTLVDRLRRLLPCLSG